jgi:membrane protease YdiL (CAAX protease family)
MPLLMGTGDLSPLDVIVVSSGAGFHEEVLFRALLFAGGAELLFHVGYTRARAVAVAAIASSLLFSLAHYVGPFGDAFALTSFVFRTLSGLYLAAVFHYRGFAVAAWTHALYDVGVLI